MHLADITRPARGAHAEIADLHGRDRARRLERHGDQGVVPRKARVAGVVPRDRDARPVAPRERHAVVLEVASVEHGVTDRRAPVAIRDFDLRRLESR